MSNSLKAGDKVIVKPLDWFRNNWIMDKYELSFHSKKSKDIYFTPSMQEFCNTVVTISGISKEKNNKIYYMIEEDEGSYYWIDDFFVDPSCGLDPIKRIISYCRKFCVFKVQINAIIQNVHYIFSEIVIKILKIAINIDLYSYYCNRLILMVNFMLYLFGSGSWKGSRKVVKIGFTKDIETRKSQYRLHNPLGEFISTREGSEEDELRLHLRLYDFKVEFLDEWFYDEDEVFNVFSQDYEEIDKWLWDHRLEVLLYPQIPPPGSMKRTIFDKIKSKMSGSSSFDGLKLL